MGDREVPEADALEQRIPIAGTYDEPDDQTDGSSTVPEGDVLPDRLREDRPAPANRPNRGEVDEADWLDQNTLEVDFEDDRAV